MPTKTESKMPLVKSGNYQVIRVVLAKNRLILHYAKEDLKKNKNQIINCSLSCFVSLDTFTLFHLKVVAWDLNTTGRRLIDEICQIGGYYSTGEKDVDSEDNNFSQYVMPYR